MTESTKIIENALVFTGDKQNRSGRMSVLVQKGNIVDLGKPAPVWKAMYPTAEVIDAKGKVILPGFVDGHHTGTSFILHYITSGLSMSKWNKNPLLSKVLTYLQKEATYDEFLKIFRLSYFSALKSGVTTIAEFGFDNPEHSFSAALEAIQQTNLKGFIGLHNGDQIEAASKINLQSVRFALVIADEENLTTYNLQSAIRMAQEFRYPIILHLGQNKRASEIIKKNFSKSITQLYNDYKIFEHPVQLLHLTCFDANDFDVVKKNKLPLILSPAAILQKETDIPPFEELLKRKIPIALSTDWGLAKPIENIQAFCGMLKMLGLSVERPYELLSLISKNGAQALGFESEIGTIEVGKKADLVFINMADFRLNPILANDNNEKILELILQNATSENISDVMISGEFYVREGHLLTFSEEELAADAETLLSKFLTMDEIKTKQSVLSAPVLKLDSQNKKVADLIEKDLPFEEGFRIIKKGTQNISNEKNIKMPDSSKQFPDNVRKIFGDDDIV